MRKLSIFNYRNFPALALLATGLAVSPIDLQSQTGPRDLAAQRFVLDDGTGSGFWLTLQAPLLTGNVTLSFPNGLGAAYFILSNSVGGQSITGGLTVDNLTLTTPLAATEGGTGFDNYTIGDLLFANTATSLSRLGIGINGQMLISNGTTPNWSNAPTIIGGTIDNTPIGGTTPSTGAFTTLSSNSTTTLGDAAGDAVTINGTSTFNANSSFNNDVALGNAAGDAITINGTSTFNASSSFNNNVTLGNGAGDVIDINGTTNFDAPATVSDGVLFTANGDVILGNTAADNITMNGAFDANDQGNVIGDGANAQQLLIDGVPGGTVELNVDGDATVNGNLVVNQSSTLGDGVGTDNLTVTTNGGNISMAAAGGTFSLSNTTGLNVATDGTLSDATGNLTVNDDLNVTGSTALGDGAGTDNLTVTTNGGNILMAAAGGTFSLSNTTGLNVATDGTLSDATGATTVNDDLSVTGNTTLGDAATDAITMNGAFDANDQGNVIGDNANAQQLLIDGVVGGTAELQLDGDADIDGNLTIDGTTTHNGNLDMNQNDIVDLGDISFSQAGSNITNTAGNINMADNVVPTADNSFSLGTDALRWSELFVNGASVHIGPTGGEAGTTEMNLGYAANTGSININGGGNEVDITATTTDINNNLDANSGVDVTGADLTVGGANFTVTVGSGNTAVGGTLTVTGTTNLNGAANIGNGNDNVSIAAGTGTFQLNSSQLDIATSGDLSDDGGAVTVADELSQTGAGQVTFSGNVDAQNGVDVTGADLTVGGANFTVTVGSGNTAVGGTLTVTGTTNLNGAANIGNGADNVHINAGTGTFQLSSSQLDIATSGDLSDDGGPVTIADELSQTGAGQVTFSGNVDAQSGVDVTGASLTVGGANFSVTTAGVLTAAGAGSSIGSNADAVQLTVDGSGAAATTNTLNVDGRANVVGDAVLNRNVTYSTGTVAAGAGIIIPANVVMVQVTDDGAAAANNVTMPAGVAGRVLYILNSDAQALTGGATTPSGQTEQFIFLGGAWRLVN